ncbi:coxI translation protein CYA5 [Purpureocillium lavendulum]|uniref:CoxI translation protein CYA5 n=1 Tax=Purpureocillium lavendulum TaxID=1247861 RepID=A0AB34G602_9HYPO|nr:coxI translation protein CYA5 [Purpureocillium lavendulum]
MSTIGSETKRPLSPPNPPSGESVGDGEQHSTISPTWQAALDRYFAELKRGGVKGSLIEKDLWDVKSPDDLIAQIEAFAPTEAQTTSAWTKVVNQLEPILLGLNDFVAIVSWSLGMNGRVAAVLWGSIRLIIKFAQPVLPDLVEMLGDLQRTLPRIRKYERELPMTDALERALSDMYSEIIIFCAHAITFFRNNPNIGRGRLAQSAFNREFTTVISNLRRYSRRVDEAADMIRLSRESQTAETVAAIRGIGKLRITNINLPCYTIPYGLNLKFFGREKEVETIRRILDPCLEPGTMKVLAIHGLGGVGKTQLALHYANTSHKSYEVIAWIPAENQIKIVQALSHLATKLGLSSEGEDDHQSVQKIRDWLNSAEKPFLLIFDNVEDADILDQIWPATSNASVLLTTRSPSVSSRRSTKILQLDCFDDDGGREVLFSLTGSPPSDENDMMAASELCRLLGGLPLAMDHLSSFMVDRGCSYPELLELYRRSAQKILAKARAPLEYTYTSTTTWDMSLEKLSTDARHLQNLLVFFDPDSVLERLITDTKAEGLGSSLQYLVDEFEDKSFYFDAVIQILYYDFPNTWNRTGPHQGHSFEAWETCSAVLPHVSWLISLSTTHNLQPSNSDLWVELIFRAGTYLWEKQQPRLAQSFFEFALGLVTRRQSPIVAQAYRLLGHISLDLAQPQTAARAYQDALSIRQELDGPDSPAVADVYDSIACSYTELGDVSQAMIYLEKATAIHNAHDPGKMSRTEAIRAMTCLRAGQPSAALDALRECWKLQGLTQEQIATSRYPKHSGDIVLLARIHWALGNESDGQQLAARALSIRRQTFGFNGGPRVADSLFILSRMLNEKGEYVLSAKLLREVIDMSQDVQEMRGHLARALWFLSGTEKAIGGVEDKWIELRQIAKEERLKTDGSQGAVDTDSDDEYLRLVSWMLW